MYGDERGSVERTRNGNGTRELEPDPTRTAREFELLVGPPFILDGPRRLLVADTIAEVCEFKDWYLHALNVLTNHVHAIVFVPISPERIMNSFKAYSTRKACGGIGYSR